jgi:hypothetical protein
VLEFLTMMKGKKTYLVGGIMVLQGIMILLGEGPTFDAPGGLGSQDAWRLILEGLGLGSLRAGVSKVG